MVQLRVHVSSSSLAFHHSHCHHHLQDAGKKKSLGLNLTAENAIQN